MKHFLKKIVFYFADKIVSYSNQKNREFTTAKYGFPASVIFDNVSFDGNIEIGERTYINEWSRIDSGENSKVVIGKNCAIGRYIHISAKSHDLKRPTVDDEHNTLLEVEGDVRIGDEVWIGDYVFVKHGVTIGNNAIVGAHSLVNRDILPFEIVGGVPVKHIRFNTGHYKFNASQA